MYSDDAGRTSHRDLIAVLSLSLRPLLVPLFHRSAIFPAASSSPTRPPSLWFLPLRARTRVHEHVNGRHRVYYSRLARIDRTRARTPSTSPDRQFGGTPISRDDARTCMCVFLARLAAAVAAAATIRLPTILEQIASDSLGRPPLSGNDVYT